MRTLSRWLRPLLLMFCLTLVAVGCSERKEVPEANKAPPAGEDRSKVDKTLEELDKLAGNQLKWNRLPHPDSKVDWVRVIAAVDAPADQVLKEIRDYDTFKDLLPSVFTHSKVTERNDSETKLKLTAQVNIAFITKTFDAFLVAKEETIADTSSTIVNVELIESGTLKRLDVRWEVTPSSDGKRSLVAFQLCLATQIEIIGPDSLYEKNEVNAKRIVENLRKRFD